MNNEFVNFHQRNQYQTALINGGKSHSNLYPYLAGSSIHDFLKSIGQSAVNLYKVASKNIRFGAGR